MMGYGSGEAPNQIGFVNVVESVGGWKRYRRVDRRIGYFGKEEIC